MSTESEQQDIRRFSGGIDLDKNLTFVYEKERGWEPQIKRTHYNSDPQVLLKKNRTKKMLVNHVLELEELYNNLVDETEKLENENNKLRYELKQKKEDVHERICDIDRLHQASQALLEIIGGETVQD